MDTKRDEFISGKCLSISSKSRTAFSPYDSQIKDRRSYERTIHFKDASSYIAFMEKYGVSTNITSILTSEIKALSRDIVIARELGSNADVFVKTMVERYHAEDLIATSGHKEGISWKGGNKLDDLKDRFLSMWEVLSRGETVENMAWANRMAGLRSWVASAHLGSHTIGAWLEDGWISGQFLSRIGIDPQQIESFRSLPLKKRKEMLSDIGILSDACISNGRRFMESEDFFKAGHSLHEKVNKWSGMEWLDQKRLSVHALVLYNLIGRMVDKYASIKDLMADPKLDKGAKAFFKQDVDFQVFKKAEPLAGVDGDLTIKTPQSIRDIPDETLHDLVAEIGKEKTQHISLKLEEIEEQRKAKIRSEMNKLQQQHDQRLTKEQQKLSSLEADVTQKDQQLQKTRQQLAKELKDVEQLIKIESKKQHQILDKKVSDGEKLKQKVVAIEDRIESLEAQKAVRPKLISDIKGSQLQRERASLRTTQFDHRIKELETQKKSFQMNT